MRPLTWALIIVGLVLAALVAGKSRAASLAEAKGDGGAVITLTDEQCDVAAVENLPLKATWTQAGKVSQGCWGVHASGIVLLYFDDKTVVIAPRSAFQMLSGV